MIPIDMYWTVEQPHENSQTSIEKLRGTENFEQEELCVCVYVIFFFAF